jgi:hypothetical protein
LKEDNKTDQCELDFNTDDILGENETLGFHEAGPNIDQHFKQFAAEYSKMTGSRQSANISDDLTHALDKLPVLTEKKRKVDMHLKVASYVFKQIQERSLDKLQDIEEEIISSGTIKGENKENLIDYLKNNQDFPYVDDPLANNFFSDKMRLAIIMILCLKNLDEMDEYVKLLE